MSDLTKKMLEIGGHLFGGLVLAFTGFQTWSLLFEASESAIAATIGLVLFEGGMVYWWFAFQKSAEGIGQMAVSFLMAVFGLLLVFGGTAFHLGAVSQTVLGENTAARLITVAAIVNLVGKFAFPLLAPETFNDIWRRALEGRISVAAFREAESKVNDSSIQLANMIGDELVRRLQVRMLTDFGLSHQLAKVIEHYALAASVDVSNGRVDGDGDEVDNQGEVVEIMQSEKAESSANGHEESVPNA